MSDIEDQQEREEIIAIQKREESLKKLMQETGCEIVQENGQRKIGGPPPNWDGPPPPKGCEVFIGRIPREVFEDELYHLFSTIGPIYELRLMMDFSGSNRGFAFVQYSNQLDANIAIRKLNKYEMRPNYRIGVLKSIDNCRLFIGSLPKDKSREEILAEMEKLTEGIADVIVYSNIADKSKNRGFAFVEYVSHRAASKARRKLIPNRVLLWGKEINVDWAQPETEYEEEVMCKMSSLYVRNVSMDTQEQDLRDLFNQHSDKEVKKIKMMRDFAFVHFNDREQAERAMRALNGTTLNGLQIEVTWAKPMKEKSPVKNTTPPSRRTSGDSMQCSPRMKMKSCSPPSKTMDFKPSMNLPVTPVKPHNFRQSGPLLPLPSPPFMHTSPDFFTSVPPPNFFPGNTGGSPIHFIQMPKLATSPVMSGVTYYSPPKLDSNGNRYLNGVNGGGANRGTNKAQDSLKVPPYPNFSIGVTEPIRSDGNSAMQMYPGYGPPIPFPLWAMNILEPGSLAGTYTQALDSTINGLSAQLGQLSCNTFNNGAGMNGNVCHSPMLMMSPFSSLPINMH